MIVSPNQFLEAYKTAVFEKNVDAFTELYDSGVAIFDTWESWEIKGLAAWREMAVGWFGSLGSDRVVVTFEESQLQTSGELAVVTAFASFAAIDLDGKQLRSLQNRFTAVLRRFGAEWKVTHEHTSVPIAHETLKANLQR